MSARCVRWFLCGCLAIVALELRLGCSLLWRSIARPELVGERELAAPRATGRQALELAASAPETRDAGQARPVRSGSGSRIAAGEPVAALQPGVPFGVLTEAPAEAGRQEAGLESVKRTTSRLVAMETQP